MPSTCVFEFDRPEPVYYSGETVNGRIRLTTTSEKNVRDVHIQFEGESKVRWEERKSRRGSDGKTQHYTVYYRGTEVYLNSRTDVFGTGTLPVGTHIYNFSIPLPLACPTSCVQKYGKISYVVSLVVNRPLRFDNIFKQPLTVIKQFDLNMHPEFLIPVKNEDIKYFCCWPCSSDPVISAVSVPFGAYAPGQQINYTIEIDNQSQGYDLEGVVVELEQTYCFTAQSPEHKSRYHSNTLAVTEQPEACLRLSKRLVRGSLTIPPVPPTHNTGIITVQYQITVNIGTGACHTNAEVKLPITIGTIPLARSARNPLEVPTPTEHPTAPPDTPDVPATPGDRPPSYDFYKPPSFEEAVGSDDKFVDTDVDERHRIDGFVPKYPMYSNFALPSAPPQLQENEGTDAPLLQSHGSISECVQPPPYPTDNGTFATPPTLANTNTTGYGWSA